MLDGVDVPRRPPKPRLRDPSPHGVMDLPVPAMAPSLPTPTNLFPASTTLTPATEPPSKRLKTRDADTYVMEEAEQALGESNPQDGGDELSGMAADFAARLSATDFRRLVHSVRGRSDLHDDVRSVPHAAGSLLDRMRRVGVPVPLSTPPLRGSRSGGSNRVRQSLVL